MSRATLILLSLAAGLIAGVAVASLAPGSAEMTIAVARPLSAMR